jgi:hypothetical protein
VGDSKDGRNQSQLTAVTGQSAFVPLSKHAPRSPWSIALSQQNVALVSPAVMIPGVTMTLCGRSCLFSCTVVERTSMVASCRSQVIYTLVLDASELTSLQREGTTSVRFVHCRTAAELCAAIRSRPGSVILPLGLGTLLTETLLQCLAQNAEGVVARFHTNELSVTELMQLHARVADVRLSVKHARNGPITVADVLQLLAREDGGPTLPALAAVVAGGAYGPEALRIILMAFLLGETRIPVADLAGACGVAVRTLQCVTTRAQLPGPHRLLLWGQCL